jgi:protein-S-isoprenylcysteine O-methyltransferase Ste14
VLKAVDESVKDCREHWRERMKRTRFFAISTFVVTVASAAIFASQIFEGLGFINSSVANNVRGIACVCLFVSVAGIIWTNPSNH